MTLHQADRALFHPFTAIHEHESAGPHFMHEARGIHVQDSGGRQYIDAMAGLWCVNVGYGRREIIEAVRQQMERMSYFHSFMSMANEPSTQLARQLAERAPGTLNHAFFCNSGSEANDTHVKLVWYYNNLRDRPKKKKIISRHSAYHGVTVAAASLSGLPNLHSGFDVPLPDRFLHVSRPHSYWDKPEELSESEYVASLADELEQTILAEGADTIAAFIAEPVMGAAGVIPPPEGYFDAICPILKAHDILLIADEVICGFGRLGRWFGSELYQIQPDLMTLAKGLTSGYIPMSACLVSDEIYDVLRQGSPQMPPFGHGFTYSAHPVAAAAALSNLQFIEQDGLVDNARQVGQHFQSELRNAVADHPLVGDVRGLGLIAGVELVKDRDNKIPFEPEDRIARRLYEHMLQQGLIARPIQNMIAFSPPLILTRQEATEVVQRFTQALSSLWDEIG